MGKLKFFLFGAMFIIVTGLLNDKKKVESAKPGTVVTATLPQAIMPSAHYAEPLLPSTNFFYFLSQGQKLRVVENYSIKNVTVRLLNSATFVLKHSSNLEQRYGAVFFIYPSYPHLSRTKKSKLSFD